MCRSFSTLGLRSVGFGSGFCSQKDRRRPERCENGEMSVHSSEIPKSSRFWLVWCPCRACWKMCFIFGNFLLKESFCYAIQVFVGKNPTTNRTFQNGKVCKKHFCMRKRLFNKQWLFIENNTDKTFFVLTVFHEQLPFPLCLIVNEK